MREISRIAEKLLASLKGLCSMELQPVYIHVTSIMGHFVRILTYVRICMRTGSRWTPCVHGLTTVPMIQTDVPINGRGWPDSSLINWHTQIFTTVNAPALPLRTSGKLLNSNSTSPSHAAWPLCTGYDGCGTAGGGLGFVAAAAPGGSMNILNKIKMCAQLKNRGCWRDYSHRVPRKRIHSFIHYKALRHRHASSHTATLCCLLQFTASARLLKVIQ